MKQTKKKSTSINVYGKQIKTSLNAIKVDTLFLFQHMFMNAFLMYSASSSLEFGLYKAFSKFFSTSL